MTFILRATRKNHLLVHTVCHVPSIPQGSRGLLTGSWQGRGSLNVRVRRNRFQVEYSSRVLKQRDWRDRLPECKPTFCLGQVPDLSGHLGSHMKTEMVGTIPLPAGLS